jgi:hypothetical protein
MVAMFEAITKPGALVPTNLPDPVTRTLPDVVIAPVVASMVTAPALRPVGSINPLFDIRIPEDVCYIYLFFF